MSQLKLKSELSAKFCAKPRETMILAILASDDKQIMGDRSTRVKSDRTATGCDWHGEG